MMEQGHRDENIRSYDHLANVLQGALDMLSRNPNATQQDKATRKTLADAAHNYKHGQEQEATVAELAKDFQEIVQRAREAATNADSNVTYSRDESGAEYIGIKLPGNAGTIGIVHRADEFAERVGYSIYEVSAKRQKLPSLFGIEHYSTRANINDRVALGHARQALGMTTVDPKYQ